MFSLDLLLFSAEAVVAITLVGPGFRRGAGRGHESLSHLLCVCQPEAGDHDGGDKEDVFVPFICSGPC